MSLGKWLPREARVRGLIRNAMPLWRHHQLIFIHIPKNGGSTISNDIYGRFLGHILYSEIQRYSEQTVNDLRAFAVLRDPVDRFISAYNYARYGSNDEESAIRFDHFLRVRRFQNLNTFCEHFLLTKNFKNFDQIFWPQIEFLRPCKDKASLIHCTPIDKLHLAYADLGLKSGPSHRNFSGTNPKSRLSDSLATELYKIYKEDLRLYTQVSNSKNPVVEISL